RRLKPLAKQIEKDKSDYEVVYFGNKDLNTIPADEFYVWLHEIIKDRKIIVVLSRNMEHIGMEFISQGAIVFVPGSGFLVKEENKNLFFYNNPMDIQEQIYNLIETQSTLLSNNKISFPTWKELSIELSRLFAEWINE
ncbi:MAG: hypothetical protein ACP5KS_14350, partial [Candidatus Hydrogenedens sp.]